MACGSGINVGFYIFPAGNLTADYGNSIISVDCESPELKARMLAEAVGLMYSMDSQQGGVNAGKVLGVIADEGGNVVGLSVDNVKSPAGMYFAGNPALGVRRLDYAKDCGGLAVGVGCKVNCCGSVAEGKETNAIGRYSHAEGNATVADWGCHAEGRYNEALGIANHVEGYSNRVRNDGVPPHAIHVEGMYNAVSGNIDAAHVGGVCARGTDFYSYTWSGVVGDVVDPDGNVSAGAAFDVRRGSRMFYPFSPYSSHGAGTFNINPAGQENGFWIGEKTLADVINQYMQPIFDVIDLTFAGDIFDTLRGRKYVPASQPNEVFVYPEDHEGLTKVIKLNPASYTSFGEYALCGCVNLKDIEIPEGISALGVGALRNCELLSSVGLPDSLKSIGNNCFRGDAILSIGLPGSLTSVGQYGLGYLGRVTTLSVPDSIVKLDAGAFGGNSSLTSINYPAGVTSPTANVFVNDYNLKEISAY